MSKRGRPTQDPKGKKRVKVQPWVHPDTKWSMEFEAKREGTTIGHIIDNWLKNRATQNTKSADKITQKTKTDLPTESDPEFF